MRKEDIIRAWKDEAFRESLTDDALAHLPAHPAGMVELSDAELGTVAGGGDLTDVLSIIITIITEISDLSCVPRICA